MSNDMETAALAVASSLTVADLTAFIQWLVKVGGGHDNAAALIEADREAVRIALDVAEAQRVNKEPLP